jgi:uncharacterized protein (TIRG00374 family)
MSVIMSGHKKHLEPFYAKTQATGSLPLRGLKLAIKFTVSTAFLVYIFYIIDLDKFSLALTGIQPEYYIFSLILLVINSFILAFKFKLIMEPSGIRQPLLSLVKINFISRFYALILTTAVGQGVVRWYQTTKNQEGKLNFLPVMVFERSSFLFTLCFFIAASWFFLVNPNSRAFGKNILPFAVTGLLCLPGIFLVSPVLFKSDPSFNQNDKSRNSYWHKILLVFRSFSLFNNKPKLLLASLGIAVLWHFAYLLRVYLLFTAVNVNINIFQLCWMASLVLFLQILPVSLNGIGLREGAYAYLFNLAGMPVEKGVLIGTLFFTQMLIASAIGGAIVISSKE